MTFVKAWAQMPDNRYYHQLSDFPFVFVSDESVTTPPVISDSLFDAVSRGIHFKVNRTELQPTDPFLTLYNEKLLPWLKSQDLELRQVFVKGAASPEGPYQNNVRLSCARAKRLITFLSEGLGQSVSENPIDSKCITEDYGLLVKMMHQANDPDYDRVNAIWLSCKGDELCCKRKLMALDGGIVWRRLLQQYFPALRQARMVLWYTRKKEVPKDITIKKDTMEVVDTIATVDSLETVVIPPVPVQPTDTIIPPVPVQPTDSIVIKEPDLEIIEEPVKYTRRHLIAARTNLLHDLLYVPTWGWTPGVNIQLEYYPLKGHYTLNAGYTHITHRHWGDCKFFQWRDAQVEVRRYFKGGGVFMGPYLSAYAEGTKYGIGFSKTKGWEGEGGGGGLSAGWVWKLNRRGSLRIEVSASVGVFITRHDPYVYGNPITLEEDGLYYYNYHGNASDFIERNHRFMWIGPTNAGVHLTYDIIYRKKKPVDSSQQKGGNS